MNVDSLGKLSNGRKQISYAVGTNENIIQTLLRSYSLYRKQPVSVAPRFKGLSPLETARNIWSFLRNEIRYQRDPKEVQLIRTPARLVADKTGDCKSYSLFAASVLHSLGLPVIFRFAIYGNDTVPSHVYVVTKDALGREIIVDGVYKYFNAEVPYKGKIDKQMEVAVLSGFASVKSRLAVNSGRKSYPEQLQMALVRVASPFGKRLIQNEIARVNGSAVNAPAVMSNRIQKRLMIAANNWKGRGLIYTLINKELNAIKAGNYTVAPFNKAMAGEEEIGKISFKKIGKGIKKGLKKVSIKNVVGVFKKAMFLVPRKAFLGLVRLNVRGLATRLQALKDSGGLKKIWVDKFGGSWGTLNTTINAGKKKKPLFGAGKRVKTINGICEIYEPVEGIAEPASASTVALLAAAAPILILVSRFLAKSGVAEVPDSNGDVIDMAREALSNGGDAVMQSLANSAQNIPGAAESGVLPGRDLTPEEREVDAALPDESSFNISPLTIAAVAGAAYLIFKK